MTLHNILHESTLQAINESCATNRAATAQLADLMTYLNRNSYITMALPISSSDVCLEAEASPQRFDASPSVSML